uniref:Uncharacterized protein n=1 Tax=Arundo donax TaxID=35708 RepID=A0A0A9CB25_ARUDO
MLMTIRFLKNLTEHLILHR